MRLLSVITSMNPRSDSPCQSIRLMTGELIKQGVHHEVVCLDRPAAPFMVFDPFAVHGVGSAMGFWKSYKNLVRWLKVNVPRFEMVIIHGIWFYHNYAVKHVVETLRMEAAAKHLPIKLPKIYVMPYGYLRPQFYDTYSRKLKAIKQWCYWKAFEEKMLNEADGLLFRSKEELRLARKSFHSYRPQKELNIGYGLPEPPSYNNSLRNTFLEICPAMANQTYFIFLSPIQEQKGVKLLIMAYSKIWEIAKLQGNERNLPALVIAGSGLETPFGQRMRLLANKKADLGKRIHLLDRLNETAKWGALYGCEALIFPGGHAAAEITVIEAMACKKPVLISNKTNLWKEIQEQDGGLVMENTEKGIQIALQAFLHLNSRERTELGGRAHGCFITAFSARQMIKRLRDLPTEHRTLSLLL